MAHQKIKFKLCIRNASQLVQVCRQKETMKTKKDMDQVEIIQNGSLVVDLHGCLFFVGSDEELVTSKWFPNAEFEKTIDATGKSIIPGLVDAHTHPVWSGDRCHEFAMKLEGATYMQIHEAGGGIGFTVKHTRESSLEELKNSFRERLHRMIQHGTTLVECKSGYGLDLETEVKMLKAIHQVKQNHPIFVRTTYLGAHSVPKNSTPQQYSQEIIQQHIPTLKQLISKGEIAVDNIDVFFEKGVFEEKETRQILSAGKKEGFLLNFHGDELHPVQSAELGAELEAKAISHLEQISDPGILAMASKQIVGVLLPTTAYILRITPPPARKMIAAGVPIALGSDFNPNAHCLSMSFVMNLACVTMKMTMNEALVAATINAAASLGCSQNHGSLEVGKLANFVIIRHSNWQHLIYELIDPPLDSCFIQGDCVYPLQKKSWNPEISADPI